MRGRHLALSSPSLNSIYRSKPIIRNLHVSTRRGFADIVQIPMHAIFTGLHSLSGLPWAASIPLTALVIHTILILPVDYRFRKYVDTRDRLDLEYRKDNSKRSPRSEDTRQLQQLGAMWPISLLRFSRVPIWLTAMGTLRQMTGADNGMLGLVGKSMSGAQHIIPNNLDNGIIPVEHSLAVEGMLWFPNLTAPDSALLLPFVVSFLFFFNVNGKPNFVKRKADPLFERYIFRISAVSDLLS